MSQAQEERRERHWKEDLEPRFRADMEALRAFRAEVMALPEGSEERLKGEQAFQARSDELEAYFIKYSP